jgi:hypothetical protein
MNAAGTAGTNGLGGGGGGGSYNGSYFAGGGGGSGVVIIRYAYTNPFPTIDCNDGNNAVYLYHSQCYIDSDMDGYTAGLAANTTCLNASSCAAATKASASSNGAAVTTYTAGQLKDAANGSDCNDANATVFASASCYHDADNDGYGAGATVYTCMNNASCASATAGAVGTGTPITGTDFSTNNTDCYDSNANAYPGQTAYFTTNRGDGSFDYNCDSAQTCYCDGNSSWPWVESGYTPAYNTVYTSSGCGGSSYACSYIYQDSGNYWTAATTANVGGSYKCGVSTSTYDASYCTTPNHCFGSGTAYPVECH